MGRPQGLLHTPESECGGGGKRSSALTTLPTAFLSIWVLHFSRSLELLQGAKQGQADTNRKARLLVQRGAVAHWKVTCCQKGYV